MSVDYLKVLQGMKIKTTVFCRSKKSSEKFKKITGVTAEHGILSDHLKNYSSYDYAIIAVDLENLFSVSKTIIESDIKNILCEKPGGITSKEIFKLENISKIKNKKLFIAYNRRFYASVNEAVKIVNKDGGIISFNFDFSEWSHVIKTLKIPKVAKKNWFLCNSSHVIDLAFFLGGLPVEISSFTSGKGNISWHPNSSIFTGSGFTKNSTFSYHANWISPGRWGIELFTKKNKIILRPLEELKIQKIGQLESKNIKIDNKLDLKYKPGLYKQVESFLVNDHKSLCSISDQKYQLSFYEKISGSIFKA